MIPRTVQIEPIDPQEGVTRALEVYFGDGDIPDYYVETSLGEAWMNFYVWNSMSRITYSPDRGEIGKLVFDTEEEGPSKKGEMFLHGSIKWDGCSNWSFPTKVMLHFCRRAETQTISPLFDLLYSIAKAEIPRADFWEI